MMMMMMIITTTIMMTLKLKMVHRENNQSVESSNNSKSLKGFERQTKEDEEVSSTAVGLNKNFRTNHSLFLKMLEKPNRQRIIT